MPRLVHSLTLGLIGAVIVHIAILLLLPFHAQDDAWSRLEAAGGSWRFVPLERAAAAGDPMIAGLACRFDLADGPARIDAAGRVPYWSLSVYSRRGHNLYSLTDRTATDRRLDMVLLTPPQMIEMRRDMPEALAGAIFVEVADPLGIVALRVFRPDGTYAPIIDPFLDSARCEPA
jgi:uncharacterized membrane protein